MRHRKFERMLVLHLNDELGTKDNDALERHLAQCAQCRAEREALRKLGVMTKVAREHFAIDESFLLEARRDLHALLQHEIRIRTRWGSRFSLRPVGPAVRLGIGFALTLAIGVVLGRSVLVLPDHHNPGITTSTSTAAIVSQPREEQTRISNVQFLDRGEGSGVVDFTFDAVTPVHLRGGVDDPAIQKVLVRAVLSDDNPGVRLRAVNAIGSALPGKTDKAIETALITALRSDPNAGVRKQALVALRGMPSDDEIKQAILTTLMSDTNPGLRIAAINALDPAWAKPGMVDQRVLDVLRVKASSDKNDYIRMKAQAVLLEKQ